MAFNYQVITKFRWGLKWPYSFGNLANLKLGLVASILYLSADRADQTADFTCLE